MIKQQGNIVQIDGENSAKLIVNSFVINNIRTATQTFDLTEHQGKPFRLYVEKDASLSTDTSCDHYWLLAEAIIPEKKMSSILTGNTDENGQQQTKCVEVPLDLNDIDITVYELPEVAE